ncbi:MAG: hypothetical protein NTY35_11045 [Planctomycetota bacterium]|nr:hypothetical protein [Planctomycetota bacterium]
MNLKSIRGAVLLAASLFLATTASAQFTLSEIYVNAPGTDNGQEGIEIRGAPNASLAGYYILSIEGDSTGAGVVDQVLDLNAFSTGANGLFLWRDAAGVFVPAADPATAQNVADFVPDLENGSNTFVLGFGTPPALAADLDSDNDGTLNVGALTGFTTVDAVSIVESDGALNYAFADDVGGYVFPQFTYTPDAVYRIYDALGAPVRWSGGDVLGTAGSLYSWDLTGTQYFQLGSCSLDLGVLNVNVPDTDGDGIPNTCDPVTAFCFGDTGNCPCANVGAAGNGCPNSVSTAGANLSVTGVASLAADTLVLAGSAMPNSSALYFQGTAQANAGLGTVFGDGLRCAAGSIIRLGTKQNVVGASQYPAVGDATVSVRGSVTAAGSSRTYQVWYRNAAAFCNAETFNLTNGVQIVWAL